MRVGLTTAAIFGDLSGYFFGIFRDEASNIIWRYATPCRPVTDCKMNDLEWPWVAIWFWRVKIRFQPALCCRIDASFGAHCTNLNEDRPILSAAKMQVNDCSFGKYKVHADIRGGSLWLGRQTTLGVVDDGNFWWFGWLRLRKRQKYSKQYYLTICYPLSAGNWLQNEWPWVAISWQNPFLTSTSWIRAFECPKNNTTTAILRRSVHCTIS